MHNTTKRHYQAILALLKADLFKQRHWNALQLEFFIKRGIAAHTIAIHCQWYFAFATTFDVGNSWCITRVYHLLIWFVLISILRLKINQYSNHLFLKPRTSLNTAIKRGKFTEMPGKTFPLSAPLENTSPLPKYVENTFPLSTRAFTSSNWSGGGRGIEEEIARCNFDPWLF